MHPIVQLFAGVPIDALEALSSKGLVRRAVKDVERGEVGRFEETSSGLVVTVGHQRVTLTPEGPARAECTCSASGVCQHILAACVSLQRQSIPENSDTGTIERDYQASDPPLGERAYAEWLGMTDSQLQKWCGVATLRAARLILEDNEAIVDRMSTLRVRFPELGVEAHIVPGSGLDGVILSGVPERKRAVIVAATVLAVWRSAGRLLEPSTGRIQTVIEADTSITSPLDVVDSSRALLEEIVATGLARLAPSAVQRLETLALTSDAPRLSHSLQRLAVHASDWLHHRPHSDLAIIFREAAFTYALSDALRASPSLRGTPRTTYTEIAALDLVGVSAWPWRAQSGYEGLTLLFWDVANKDWTTWTDARPRAFQGVFSASARYEQAGPWTGADSPARLAGSRFRLLKPRRNRWGRLSSSAQTHAIVTGPASNESIGTPVSHDWNELTAQAISATPIGLRERDPRRAFAIVRPSAWQPMPFDRIEQSLHWILLDERGAPLHLRVPYDEMAKPLIGNLEAIAPSMLSGAQLVGRIQLREGELQIFPLTLITAGKLLVLAFQHSPAAGTAKLTGSTTSALEEDTDEIEEPPPWQPRGVLAELLLEVTSVLEWFAESGSDSGGRGLKESIGVISRRVARLNLTTLSHFLRHLESNPQPRRLLQARWIVEVMMEAARR